jgi:hypothetical protein
LQLFLYSYFRDFIYIYIYIYICNWERKAVRLLSAWCLCLGLPNSTHLKYLYNCPKWISIHSKYLLRYIVECDAIPHIELITFTCVRIHMSLMKICEQYIKPSQINQGSPETVRPEHEAPDPKMTWRVAGSWPNTALNHKNLVYSQRDVQKNGSVWRKAHSLSNGYSLETGAIARSQILHFQLMLFFIFAVRMLEDENNIYNTLKHQI